MFKAWSNYLRNLDTRTTYTKTDNRLEAYQESYSGISIKHKNDTHGCCEPSPVNACHTQIKDLDDKPSNIVIHMVQGKCMDIFATNPPSWLFSGSQL